MPGRLATRKIFDALQLQLDTLDERLRNYNAKRPETYEQGYKEAIKFFPEKKRPTSPERIYKKSFNKANKKTIAPNPPRLRKRHKGIPILIDRKAPRKRLSSQQLTFIVDLTLNFGRISLKSPIMLALLDTSAKTNILTTSTARDLNLEYRPI
ncbi:hypothetical protein L249_7444 [Ophiocordyceps polyrhachis-furcata BCC 54312]|uniref:Uncharacterized protein n=1 Tax=Ophiocordyceps polyrhachis-furcata BCC 54312 TaxID=1330021 RepID=A0A367L9Q0_9HYPO|nr:hypothetical protein L249_7444 [Ophiocordyceps polyrhachis-furcata BCC 54312]